MPPEQEKPPEAPSWGRVLMSLGIIGGWMGFVCMAGSAGDDNPVRGAIIGGVVLICSTILFVAGLFRRKVRQR